MIADDDTDNLGWWFSISDTLPHGDGRKIVIGETLTVEGPIVPCERGLHDCPDPFDALQYAPGALLWRVRRGGVSVQDGDKWASSERTALAKRDATEMLRAFERVAAGAAAHAAAWAAAWDARAAAWAAARKLFNEMVAELFEGVE